MTFAKAQSPMKEHMARAAIRPHSNWHDYTLIVGNTKLLFLTLNEMKDDVKWMNENKKLHKMGQWQLDSVGEMKLGKRKNAQRKISYILAFPTTSDPLMTPSFELGNPVVADERSNRS